VHHGAAPEAHLLAPGNRNINPEASSRPAASAAIHHIAETIVNGVQQGVDKLWCNADWR